MFPSTHCGAPAPSVPCRTSAFPLLASIPTSFTPWRSSSPLPRRAMRPWERLIRQPQRPLSRRPMSWQHGRHDAQFPVVPLPDRIWHVHQHERQRSHRPPRESGIGPAIHPNDHVNASQSSNDTFPTAIHLAVAILLRDRLSPPARLGGRPAVRSRDWREVVKPGRTHLMDAAPVTLGQEFDGFAAQVHNSIARIESAVPRLLEVPLGGTAVGTGLNAPPGFAERTRGVIADRTGIVLAAPLSAHGGPVEPRRTGRGLRRTAGYRSFVDEGEQRPSVDGLGATAGLAEIGTPCRPTWLEHHARQGQPGDTGGGGPGVLPGGRAGRGCCARRDDLGVPAQHRNAADRLQHRRRCPPAVRERRGVCCTWCLHITIEPDLLRRSAESSPAIATSLNLLVGYDAAAAVVKRATAEGVTIREAAQTLVDDGLVSARGPRRCA